MSERSTSAPGTEPEFDAGAEAILASLPEPDPIDFDEDDEPDAPDQPGVGDAAQPAPSASGTVAPPADKATAAAPEAPASPPAPSPASAATGAPASAGTPLPNAQPTSSSAPDAQPFAFAADGRRVEHAGLTHTPDGGVHFTREAWDAFRPNFIADRSQWRDREAQHAEQMRQKDAAIAARDQAYGPLLDEVQAALNDPDEAKALDAFFKLRAEVPQARLRADAQFWKHAATSRVEQDRQQKDQARETERLATVEKEAVPAWVDGDDGFVAEVLKQPQFADLAQDAAFRNRLSKTLKQDWDRFLVRTDQLDPQTDLPVYRTDPARFWRLVEGVAETQREMARQLAAIQGADQRNRERGAPRPDAPPAVSTTGTPASGTTKKTFKSREEYDEYMRKLAEGEIEP